MLGNRLARQNLHLAAQQLSQLGRNHLFRDILCRHTPFALVCALSSVAGSLRRGKVLLLVNGLHDALEAAEECLCADQG